MAPYVNRWAIMAIAAIWPATCFAGAAEVVGCRDIRDDAQRLACFDRTVGGLATDLAAQKKPAAERFGLSSAKPTTEKEFGLPSQKAPPTAADRTVSQPAPMKSHAVPPVTNMADKLRAISYDEGKPVFAFENGQVWIAQENRHVTFHGDGSDHAMVKRAVLGYLITVNDSSAEISVRRLK